jgi:hypothetical protein
VFNVTDVKVKWWLGEMNKEKALYQAAAEMHIFSPNHNNANNITQFLITIGPESLTVRRVVGGVDPGADGALSYIPFPPTHTPA